MIDKSKLKELALAAKGAGWWDEDSLVERAIGVDGAFYIAATNPAAILELLAELETVRAVLKQAAGYIPNIGFQDTISAALATTTSTEPTAPSASASPAAPTAPKMTIRDGIWWPEGYCTDPDGHIVAPAGKDVDFKFGYDIGYAEGIAVRRSAAPVAGSQQVPDSQAKATHEQALAGYAVACKFGVYEARAFNLADEMFAAFAAAAPAVPVPAEQRNATEFLDAYAAAVQKAMDGEIQQIWQIATLHADLLAVERMRQFLGTAPSLQQPKEGAGDE